MIDGDTHRLVNIASAYCFKEGRMSTKGRSDIDHFKNVGQISTIMRASNSKDGELTIHFDKIHEYKL